MPFGPVVFMIALTRGTLQDEVCLICLTIGRTVFMITHGVDQAIYIADRIVLMTNCPGAVLAEIVDNSLPKARVHRLPQASALIEEEFGDGIMSAIDFDTEITRKADPKGDRVQIGMSGKFLPFRYYGAKGNEMQLGFKEE
jgi:hypothetical protein